MGNKGTLIEYDVNGNCTFCGLPGTGFVEDGVCQCLEWADEIDKLV